MMLAAKPDEEYLHGLQKNLRRVLGQRRVVSWNVGCRYLLHIRASGLKELSAAHVVCPGL
jgi:hypothetical protein